MSLTLLSSRQACYLCGSEHATRRKGVVRDDPQALIFECSDCGLVFLTGKNLNYENGEMEAKEVLLWLKDAYKDDKRRFDAVKSVISGKKVLDFGCGAGGFLILAKNVAEVEGIEVDKRLFGHFIEFGLEVKQRLEGDFDVITAFHVLEHMDDPGNTLREFKNHLKDGGRIIVEVPSSDDALLTLYESEPFSRFTYWSAHRFLFNRETLKRLAEQAGLKVEYIKGIQRYPLSNHLHWMAKGEGGTKWAFLDSPELDSAYQAVLASIGKTDTLMASFYA